MDDYYTNTEADAGRYARAHAYAEDGPDVGDPDEIPCVACGEDCGQWPSFCDHAPDEAVCDDCADGGWCSLCSSEAAEEHDQELREDFAREDAWDETRHQL